MQTVVAAAIVRDGRLLAAQRTYPPEFAGQWELPGGKVDPGEAEPAALRRECREELGVVIDVHERIGHDLPTAVIDGVLRVYACELIEGEPAAIEHSAFRWVDATELEDLVWLETDRPLVPALRELLTRKP